MCICLAASIVTVLTVQKIYIRGVVTGCPMKYTTEMYNITIYDRRYTPWSTQTQLFFLLFVQLRRCEPCTHYPEKLIKDMLYFIYKNNTAVAKYIMCTIKESEPHIRLSLAIAFPM